MFTEGTIHDGSYPVRNNSALLCCEVKLWNNSSGL